jgi:PilZ domain
VEGARRARRRAVELREKGRSPGSATGAAGKFGSRVQNRSHTSLRTNHQIHQAVGFDVSGELGFSQQVPNTLGFSMLQPVRAGLSTPSPTHFGVEQRAWVRHPDPTNGPYQLIDAETEYGWWASVRDVSLGGLAMVLSQRLSPGTRLIIDKPLRPGKPWHALSVRVVHATACAEGWLLGCEFAHPLSEADLEALLQPAEQGTPGLQPMRFLSFDVPAGAER